MKSKNLFSIILSIILTFTFVFAVAHSATIINTNINTGGTLSLIDSSPNTFIRDLYIGRNINGVFIANTTQVDTNPENYIFFYKSTTGLIDSANVYAANDEHKFWVGLGYRVGEVSGPTYPLRISHDGANDQGGVEIREARDLTTAALANNVYNVLKIMPTINLTSSNKTIRGIYYNPTLTATVGLTHIAFQNTAGDILFNTTSGSTGIGTTTPYGKFQATAGGSGTTAVSTTTITLGEIGTTTSKTCFNIKNTAGAGISFYFNALNAMVIEANLCR
jgi:hypothetical protein